MLNWGLLTLKFLISKGYQKKNEKGITDWEKIFILCISDKVFTHGAYGGFL